MRIGRLASTDVNWISTYGGRFIVLADSLLSDWRGYPDESADPLDTSHDYGRACATSGYAATIPVGSDSGLVFGENESGGVWLHSSLPILFEWVCADSADAVVAAISRLPERLPHDETTEFEVTSDKLVVFDSAFAGDEYEPQHSCRFAIRPARYLVGSSYYKPNDNTGLIIHRFLPG